MVIQHRSSGVFRNVKRGQVMGPVDGRTEVSLSAPRQEMRAGAPRGVGSGEGAVAPPQYGGLGAGNRNFRS